MQARKAEFEKFVECLGKQKDALDSGSSGFLSNFDELIQDITIRQSNRVERDRDTKTEVTSLLESSIYSLE